MSFVHLHVHTQYSLLDGLNRTDKLFEKVKSLGMDTVAMTDHGVMYGAAEFWKLSKDFGVKPILGCEIYLSPAERTLRSDVNGIRYYHLLLLAKNLAGYKNLIKLVSIGHTEGMYYKPRVDLEMLKKHSEGLICTSACLAGPLSRHIIRDQLDKAEEWLKALHSIFKDDFYLELQRNGFSGKDEFTEEQARADEERASKGFDDEAVDSIRLQVKVNLKLREYADKYKLPLVATTDAHYLNKEDRDVQKILFCIKDGVTQDDPNAREGYIGTYIKSPEEMAECFSDDLTPIENTLKINEKIENFSIAYDRVQPQFWNISKEKTEEQMLREDTFNGAKKKYGELTPELEERINGELKVIHDKGYDGYFLIVADIMNFAAAQGILMGVRGSVAGSVVAYCLGIVGIDPIKWELYFERFLNPERPSPPDIDMDIQDSRRDEVIQYVEEKYGKENIAAIAALGRLKTRAAIRDVSRTMGIDLRIADTLSKRVIVLFGKPYTFEKMMGVDAEFKNIVDSDPQLVQMGEVVKKIEGLSRHVSMHAAGYLITPEPITNYVPVQVETKTKTNKALTQFEFPWLEELGLMKFDFLGLRTLTIVDNCLRNIERSKGLRISVEDIPDDDKATYELFGRGETIGVFQFESPPMQQYLKDLQPETQEDICFLAAAYRPGPMDYIPDYIERKHGKQETVLLTPELEPIVGGTYGFAIYQEQVIRIAVEIAGYTMGGADVLRRAMGKKKHDVMEKEEVIFKKGVTDKGISEEIAQKLWEYLLPFADYGFNKAHAAGYAVLAYRCAYLKAHYPLEFVTALMHSDLENTDRITVDIREAKRLGFRVLPPSINKSDNHFVPEGEDGIRFGLGAIKNVGHKVCEKIVEEREANGEFKSFDDLVVRVGIKNISKKASECLIKAGAMDDFIESGVHGEGSRNSLLEIIGEVYQKASKDEKAVEMGQTGLFNAEVEHDAIVETDATRFPFSKTTSDVEKMNWEKELLGIFVSTHPLSKFKWASLHAKISNASEIENMDNQASVKILGTFTSVKHVFTKKDNSQMAIVTIEDASGKCDGVIFPKNFEKYQKLEMIVENRPFIISGKVNFREERCSLIIESIEPANVMKKPSKVRLDIRGVTDKHNLEKLKTYLRNEKEGKDVELKIVYGTNGNSKELVRYASLENEDEIALVGKWVV